MLDTSFRAIAAKHNLSIASGAAYGVVNGCFVTLSSGKEYQRISIYVGPQYAPDPNGADSPTVSCAKQIIHTITTASGEENNYALLLQHDSLPALVLNHAGSVVTVNFSADEAAIQGIERFIAEILPQIAGITAPAHCILCGQPTNGEGCPVRLSGDTVVPMHAPCCEKAAESFNAPTDKSSNSALGIIGAVCGALIGAAVWAAIFQFGFITSIAGLLIGFLASCGYDLLKGRPGKAKLITVIVCCVIGVALGTLVGTLIPYYTAFGELGMSTQARFEAISPSMPGWFTYMRGAVSVEGAEFWKSLALNMGLGILFAGVGCLDLLRRSAEDSDAATKPRRLKGKC